MFVLVKCGGCGKANPVALGRVQNRSMMQFDTNKRLCLSCARPYAQEDYRKAMAYGKSGRLVLRYYWTRRAGKITLAERY